ncbi:phage tail tape measure protein [Ewingella americana]|uniref:Phage tail length tape-measure protein n=1 Tax=Ewingella americana (strain ATCC 33852 / DSM 4580 / CCUG 14506 / JCM 5911 / LMG 7869 / NCTC 12157 / CDC 1468-78) TaxID=910964 RepID=A0A085G102_EWIA3|nr:phage tail tape measure protein [Ewingella americana]KAA8726749.1 phage tail tape measure protein [Ewingella americana]KFC77397.1 phage tail length tape-measure protein [Ewingella americana ATCC 33852]
MSQQISDLVINLDVDNATFTEQIARIKSQLKNMADDSDKSLGKVGQAAERQAAALKQMGDAGARAANDIQAQQSAAASAVSSEWQKTEASMEGARRAISGMNVEQLSNIKSLLAGMTAENEKVLDRLGSAADRQAGSLMRMGEAGARASEEIREKQSLAANAVSSEWQKSAASMEGARRALSGLNTDQLNSVKSILSGMSEENGKVFDRLGRATEQQTESMVRLGAAGANAANEIRNAQTKAAGDATSAWNKSAETIEETIARAKELIKQNEDNAAGTKENRQQQEALTNSFLRQINSIKDLKSGTAEMAQVRQKALEELSKGNLTGQDHLAILGQITQRQKQLTAEDNKAAAAKANFIQKLKSQLAAQKLTSEELLRNKAAQLGVSNAAEIYISKLEAAKKSTHGLGLESAGARREIGILIGEVARGNFGSLRGSSITLANRAGWIEQLLTLRGLGIAGVVGGIAASIYGLGKAWYEGSQESAEFNKQLILTGDYAGKTSGQLAELAKSIGGSQATNAAALAQVVGSGSFKGSQIESVTRAAVAMQEATGKSVEETIKNFEKLYDSPTKASSELNKQLHYLTAGQFEYISQLERRGDKEAAGQAAADAYSRAEQQRSQQILDNLGLVERAALATRNAFKNMWDELLNIGRGGNDAATLQTMKDTLAEIQENSQQGLLGRFKNNAMGVDKAQLEADIRNLEFVVKSQEGYNRSKAEFNKINNDGIEAQVSFNKYLDAGTTQAEKRALAQKDLNKAIADNAAAAKATQGLSPDKQVSLWSSADIEKARAGIEKLYKDPKTAKAKGYVTPAGDRAEDSAQKDLIALQSQLKVLQEHKSITDTISQQRKELWGTEAQFSVLEDASRTRQLSKQEKSLLSSKEQVLQLARQKALLGDQIVAQEQLNKRMDTSQKYVTQMAEKQSALMGSATMSDRMAGRESTFAQLRSGWKNAGGSLDDEGYQRQLAAAKQYYAAEDNLRGNWQAGIQKSWADYADTATNSYEQIKNVSGSAFNGVSSQLTTFLTTGKASFKDFTKSILSMLTDILVKMSLVNGLNSAASAFGWGGLKANANGGVYTSSGLSAFSGSVVDKPTFFAFAKGGGVMGEAGPEAILPLRRGANGKLGVVAGTASGGGSPVFNNTIILQSDGSASAKTSGADDAVSKSMMKVLDQFCQKNILKELRSGGILFNALKSR